MGQYFVQELLKKGRHRVTALTRKDSSSRLPDGIKVKKVDYEDTASLEDALRGQDVLIITLAVTAPPDTHSKLIKAAAAAGVPWVIPNHYGHDLAQEKLGADNMLGPSMKAAIAEIEKLEKSSWMALVCNFWYEFSLAGGPERFGFDLEKRELTLFDDGNERINTSTWPQCGRAIASLLSMKVLPDDADDRSPCLSQFKNGCVYISSFLLNQREVFESVKRVTGTTDSDWKVTSEPSENRFEDGKKELSRGARLGFAKLLYCRMFYPTGEGNYESKGLLHNKTLGLPNDDLDEYTKLAVRLGGTPY